ncbi:MAG: circadian clock KaiB family protein [Rhodospirillales bacterium]|nr:circadian clock KaiB family protein [Rhodospirillales bacterium]
MTDFFVTKLILKLFVSDFGPVPETAISGIKKILRENIGEQNYALEVINISKNPELAIEDRVMATPTLVKASPYPQVRLIGNFSDAGFVLRQLGLIS